ncbi:hypothetical protein [Streptomyces sp. NPDC001089]
MAREFQARMIMAEEGAFVGDKAVSLEGHTHPAPAAVLSAGKGTVPTLLASATANVVVTLKPGFADTSYSPAAQVVGGVNLLSALSIQSTTVTTKDTVTVVVKNTGLVSLGGATVLVTAIHD